MQQLNCTCKTCGKKYHYCPTCGNGHKEAWMGVFHDRNCKDVFDILVKYSLGRYTAAEAREALAGCDLSNQAGFLDDIRDMLDKVYSSSAKSDPVPEPDSGHEGKAAAKQKRKASRRMIVKK